MPHSTRAKSRAVQNLLPNPEQQAWWFVKHLLRTSLQDTRSLLLTWTHTRQTETLHQARVAWRRQKSLLKFYRPLLPESPQRHNDALQTLWRLTGQLRNLDVALECTLPAWRQAHPDAGTHEWAGLVQQLHQDRQLARHALAKEIARPSTTARFQQLRTWMKRLDSVTLKVRRKSFEQWAQHRLRRLHQKIKSQQHPFTPERQHRCRILLKQERHALESLLANHPDKKRRARLKRNRKKQIAWGHDQDMQTALELIEGLGHCPELTKAWRASM